MKVQPNFSWQKYQGSPQDQQEQFQYQLQQEHIVVANAINTTIDDLSYFTRERVTGFRWIDGQPIYTKSFTGTLVASGSNTTPHGITSINKLVSLRGVAQDAVPLDTDGIPLPYIDPSTLANGIGLSVDNTNYYITCANSTFNGYLYTLTIDYTKVKNGFISN